MHKLLAAAVVSMAASLAACAAPTGPTEESSTTEATDGLVIASESDSAIAGSFTRGDSLVTFSSRLEAPFVKTHLEVNGAAFDYVLDVVESKLTIDGHANTILGADSEVLAQLEKAFEKLGGPTKIREALFKTVSMMAGAPRGTTLMVKVVVPRVEAKGTEIERGYCDNEEGIGYLCDYSAPPPGCSAYYVGLGGPDGANPIWHANSVVNVTYGHNSAQYGSYVAGCQYTSSAVHEHEVCESSRNSSSHGRVTWGQRIGWAAAQCEGRCGAGCANSYNFYNTKDCLDHDACLNNHPGAASNSTYGDCGNEWDRAQGDWSFGTGSSFRNACGFWAVGENSR